MKSITITQSIFINRSPEKVWDFTQDYSKRTLWDKSILESKLISTKPTRVIQLKYKGNLVCRFEYKQDERPRKTTLVMTDIESSMVVGGGGSWKYELTGKGTMWTQTNTVILRNNFWLLLFSSLIKSGLKRSTKQSMSLAKKILERQ